MHASATVRLARFTTTIIATLLLAGCFGEGDGQQRILGTPAPAPPPIPDGFCDPINFEDICGSITFNNFEGGVASIIDNPQSNGINTSDKVGQMQKFSATSGATFGGSTIGFDTAFEVAAGSSFTMKVWSQRAVRVLFQPEPAGPGTGIELTHGGTGWEELTFDFGSFSGTVSGITLIFDNGTLGNAANDPNSWTFYFDDITLVAGGGGGTTTTLPVNFENDPASYDFGMDAGFGGGASDVIANPDSSGINTSAQTARMQKFAGEVFGGSTLSLAGDIDFSQGEVFKMKVWASRAVPVLLKFEGLNAERSVDHSGSSTWEELCFDFSGSTAGPASSAITFIFDLGVNGNADNDASNWTFYYDEIQQTSSCAGGGGGTAITLPVTFEDAGLDYELVDFGGVVTTMPFTDPADAGNTVASSNKPPGAQTWGGTTVANASGFGALPFTASDTLMTVRVYSPDAGIPVRLKVEDSTDVAISVETEATTTVANGWETLTFDFANEVSGTAALNLANTYDKASIFFNFGTDGDTAGDKTYLWDDLTFGGAATAAITLPVTFEDSGLDYELVDFGGVITTMPFTDPADAGNTVASSNKPPGAQTWGGTTVANASGFGALPFTASDTLMTVRVYSPDAGIPVRLKVEDSTNVTISVETEATTTVANGWETLTFDFANEVSGTAALNLANTYDKASIFFNFGTDGDTAGDKTYLWDDLTFVTGGGGGSSSVDFEGGSYTFNDFGGAVAAVVANPDSSGINTSTQVAQMQKFDGEIFAGSTLVLANATPLAAGDSYTMKVRSQRSVVVTLKLEPLNEERTATHSGSGTWEELCFDFTGVSGDVTGLTVIFDNGTAGDAAGDPDNWTFQYDDMQQTSNACPTGGTAITLPVTFEDAGLDYELVDFGGVVTTMPFTDPADAGNTVASSNKPPGAQTWGGTTVANASGFGALPFTASDTLMTVRVYSPDAGIPVRLKVEDSTDVAISVETEATTTVANGWETLTFDFANEVSGTAALNLANTYDKASIFFNFGTDGDTAGDKTYLWDDLTFGGAATAAITLPVTFEDSGLDYELVDFGGVVTTMPFTDPADAGNTVASSNKPPGAQTWGGTTVANASGFGALPFTASDTLMTVRVYSPDAGIPVRLKVEDSTNVTISVETEATTTVANGWETLTFDFANEVSGTAALNLANTYDKASIFFNFGTDGDTAGDKTYLWDDLTFGGAATAAITLPVTFEDSGLDYELVDFGGVVTTMPFTDPADAGNTVASSNKPPGAQTWGGTTVANASGFGALPFTASDTLMTVRVYSPDAGIPVRLKVEDSTNVTISVETEATTTVANGWETLTFDFANEVSGTAALNLANTYDKASIFFNFGTDGDTAGDKTYLWDDLTFGGAATAAITLPVTFEDSGLDYELVDFGGVVTTMPFTDPADAGNTVASSNKPPGAQTWGGTTVANASGFGALPFTASDTLMTVRVYSPDAGIPVRLKVEDSTNVTISVETEATTTVANGWETLTFDFANEVSGTAALNLANTYDKASIFFNFGTDGDTAGDKTYLWDDLTFVTGGGGGSSSVDFEGGSYTFNDFGGAVAAVVANPDSSGINTSTQVAQMQKFDGEIFAGSTLVLANATPLAAGDSYTMKVRSQRSVVVTLKLEPLNEERTATHSGSGTWEELCFDFTGVSGDVTGLTVIFDNGTAGDAAGDPDNWTFQYDDMQQTSNACPTGGTAITLPVTFEDAGLDYELVDFGGVVTTMPFTDPADAGNTVASSNKPPGAQTWGGTTVANASGFGALPFTASDTLMTVRVYSPDAGIPVRLKVEDSTDVAISVETEATTTVANGWETLTFDFANEVSGTAALNLANTYDKASIFFNFGTDGDTAGDKTYLWDDLTFVTGGGGGGGGGGTAAVDFESASTGAGFTWAVFENDDNPALQIIANPDATGINTSANVGRFTARLAGQPFAGVETAHGDIGPLTLDSSNSLIKVMVWKSVISDVGVKFAIANGGAQPEIKVANTAINQWEELSFDLSGYIGRAEAIDIDQLIIFPDFQARSSENVVYFDNVSYNPVP